MELKDTIKLMNSRDYKERFKAEYLQTKIRYKKLHDMIIKSKAEILDFELCCSIEILENQKSHMGGYLEMLEIRANIENIKLD